MTMWSVTKWRAVLGAVALIAALLCSQVQCFARCAGVPCQPQKTLNLPPCHRQTPATPQSAPCQAPLLLVAEPQSAAPVVPFMAPALDSIVWINALPEAISVGVPPDSASPPPDPIPLRSVILRV